MSIYLNYWKVVLYRFALYTHGLRHPRPTEFVLCIISTIGHRLSNLCSIICSQKLYTLLAQTNCTSLNPGAPSFLKVYRFVFGMLASCVQTTGFGTRLCTNEKMRESETDSWEVSESFRRSWYFFYITTLHKYSTSVTNPILRIFLKKITRTFLFCGFNVF